MINLIGNSIVHSMRSCVASSWLPAGIKAPWIFLCSLILKRHAMKSFEAAAITQYGSKLAGNPADSTLNLAIVYRDVFEPTLSDLICTIVQPGDVCLDVGANAGYFTLLFAQRVGPSGKVIAIEAAPGNAAQLTRNVELNNFGDRVDVVAAACSDAAGEMTFYIHPVNDMLCRLELPKKNELDYWLMGKKWLPVSVRADRLTVLAGDAANDISFIKLDIEGFEHRVVNEILQNFAHPRLCIAIEAKAPHVKETLKPFEDAGFFAYNLQNDYKWLYEKKYKAAVAANYADLYKEKYMVDVLLTRLPLPL